MAARWYVYMLECADGSLYTGATNDVASRVAAHGRGQGAKYTRARLPVRLVWTRRYADKSSALSAEYRVKQLGRPAKLQLAFGRALAPAVRRRR